MPIYTFNLEWDKQYNNIKRSTNKGNIVNNYIPFRNLIKEDSLLAFDDFNTTKLKWDLNHPVDIKIQDLPDGSVNLILNDDINKPMLINSRFSTAENNTYIIPDHFGDKDTSIYEEKNIELDTSLYKIITKIPKLQFLGLLDNGFFKCGSYYFYFKLCDNDDNESDFIAESGVVTCHIGDVNKPQSIRMGLLDENSEKSIKFKLTNLDGAYDFIKVYYSRTTSGEDGNDITNCYKILNKFPIESGEVNLQLFGNEPNISISVDEINEKFQYCQHVKALAICQNRLFLGNIQKPEIDYEKLLQFALNIIPKMNIKDSIGQLDSTYSETSRKNSYGYYNALNTYYRLGYWPEEYYRFGIVFILNDFTLSNVFNIRGLNLLKVKDNNYIKYYKDNKLNSITYNEDGFLIDLDNKINQDENALGITVLDKVPTGYNLSMPICVEFSLSEDYQKENVNVFDDIKKYIKGFFFVRQKRKPIILAQGYAIGKTNKNFGNLPCLNYNKNYFSESFLSYDKDSVILKSSRVNIKNSNVEIKAAYVPDAIIREPLFNQIFLGQDFRYDTFLVSDNLVKKNRLFYPKQYKTLEEDPNSKTKKYGICKFLNIPTGIKITTNNIDYFSSLAGIPEDVSKFSSVDRDWKHEGSNNVSIGETPPNNFMKTNVSKSIPFLLKKDRVIRGMFGSYVGLSSNNLSFGDIFNIRKDDYNPDSYDYINNLIKIRKNDHSSYSAISERYDINDINKEDIITCYRGDCYICNFTHRVIRNHIDPELPTNNKIVDSQCWDDNFLVITKSKYEDTESPTGSTYVNEIIPLFKAKNLYDPMTGKSIEADKAGIFFAKLFTLGLGIGLDDKKIGEIDYNQDLSDLNWKKNNVKVILPTDSKYSKAGSSGELFGLPNTWYEYGTSKINRSDINSVNLGHWVTIKVMSNYNLCMRDIDPYHTDEKVIFNHPRGFYPYQPLSIASEYKLPESKLINGATNLTLSNRYNYTLPNTPYINQQYDTRILYSDVYNGGFKNGFRIFRYLNYRDYPKTYGALVKMIEWQGDLICIMEHGILKIPVNERALGGEGSGGSVYINTDNVLPLNPMVISDTFGSIWADSVLKTDSGIYGVDTYGKKIWVTNGSQVPTLLSDFKLQKYLNDNINLSEWDKQCEIGFTNVKTHYNKFKRDVMFTFYNDDKIWNLCYNEYLGKFVTFYSWTPSYSENINNIFISLDLNDTRNILDSVNGCKNTNFYKHLINRMGLKLEEDKINQSFNNDKILSFIDIDEDYLKDENLSDLDNGFKHPYPRLYDSSTHPDNKYVQFKIEDNKYSLIYNEDYKKELKNKKYLNIKFKAFYYLDFFDLELEKLKLKEEYDKKIESINNYYDPLILQEKNPSIKMRLIIIRNNKLKEEQNKYLEKNKEITLYYNNNFSNFLKTLKQKDLYLRLYNPNKCTNELWKHGQAGIFDGLHDILPTKWYDQQEPFEFEFVISDNAVYLKVFYTLMMLSNKAQPEEFEFEVVGESYDWFKYKDIIIWANKMSANEKELKLIYKEILLSTQKDLYDKYVNYPKLKDVDDNYVIKSIPFIRHIRKDSLGVESNKFEANTSEVKLIRDELLNENRIRQSLTCNNVKKLGRISGNSEYIEDNWYVQIRPMNFKIAYFDTTTSTVRFKKLNQFRIRDKYIKIKVKYSGIELAIILGIQTLYDYSYA